MPALLSSRLRLIAASHPAARRFLLARRNQLVRSEPVAAVSGRWAHEQLVAFGASIETFLWCPHEAEAGTATLAAKVSSIAQASYEISPRTLARLQPDAEPPGLLSLVRLTTESPERLLRHSSGTVLVADGIEYAGNLGALLRVVDAAGARGMLVTNPVARLTSAAVFSASRGTVLTTPTIVYDEPADARSALQEAGWEVVVATPDSVRTIADLPLAGPRRAIVVGSEGAGVSPVWRSSATWQVSIPMRGRADSLNVATAAAVLLFHGLAPLGS